MGFLDKAKAAAEQAAARAKEGVEDVQAKRDLSLAYGELGKATFRLVEGGELSNPELAPLVEKIRTLEARGPADTVMAGAATTTTNDPPPSDQPPAMPT
jgi:hypothetical protein